MELLERYHMPLVEDLCCLVYEKKFREAEALLLLSIEKALSSTDKSIFEVIYCSFNNLYSNWLIARKIFTNDDSVISRFVKHSNLLISHCTQAAEMDDLLYSLIHHSDTVSEKNEIIHALVCYKQTLS